LGAAAPLRFPAIIKLLYGHWRDTINSNDRMGTGAPEAARSWNTSHPSRGCSQDTLRSSGGAGLLYCFATN
jgi:hypothetical protein